MYVQYNLIKIANTPSARCLLLRHLALSLMVTFVFHRGEGWQAGSLFCDVRTPLELPCKCLPAMVLKIVTNCCKALICRLNTGLCPSNDCPNMQAH